MNANKRKIILICSGGGHFVEMLQLEEMFTKYDYLLVTEETKFTLFFKELYNISFIKPRPTGKKRGLSFLITLAMNLFLSIKLIAQHYPKAIISTGSHTAVPMCLLGHLLGIKIVFILSYARINSRAKAADIIYPIADRFIIQWPDAGANYEKGIFLGGVY
jgi:beta-1,4-N-acetylglucosaminyltransferase